MDAVKTAMHVLVLAGAAAVGAAAGDLLRQRIAHGEGTVLSRRPDGRWSLHITPQILIPAVIAGFRSREKGLLRAGAVAALVAAGGGRGLGGIAGSFFQRRRAGG